MNVKEDLTGDDIFNRLKYSDRWGANSQPSIYLATAVLELLPISWLTVNDDTLQIAFSRDLTPLELWSIERLCPDRIQRDEGWQIDLWWD